ncbi:hypothetical protein C427_1570 [Paraglaciecola psychrophila 170]|uniref:Lipoprotein n=1 Tax=Paraglaciecola psychrophila 170 TaxID=1129794 RepID=K7A4W3_9ALTE|nr:hypothetical protein C427_1570 [Paraglaciecola psychrophila 170]GAC35893.1 hypothetical protein GPSY_0251 [Paraglaciecola psychrophila 170]
MLLKAFKPCQFLSLLSAACHYHITTARLVIKKDLFNFKDK